MTRSFLLTPSASRDVDGILEYVLEHNGPNRALLVHCKLYEGFSKVGAQPAFLGHQRDDLADESLRVVKVFSYLIIFRPDMKPVQIIRVIHGARDLPRAFEEDA
jgi:toxin ParE1/3/4